MQALLSLRQLTDLNLRGLDRLTDASMQCLQHMKRLRRLTLRGCNRLTAHSMSMLAQQGLTALEELSLQECSRMCDLGMLPLSLGMLRPRRLNLKDCDCITGAGLTLLATTHHGAPARLVSLNLARCVHIDDNALCALAPVAHQLQDLSLSGCCELTDDALSHLAAFTSLRRLSLKYCRQVGRAAGCLYG